MEIVIKLGLIFLSVSLLFFLTIVLPRLKAPGWERKIEAARYLREKQMPGQADELLEGIAVLQYMKSYREDVGLHIEEWTFMGI